MKKKIRLNVDGLVVETFDVAGQEDRRGTVLAHQPTYEASCTCVDCGESGYWYSCFDTNCPSACAIIYCDTYDYCEPPPYTWDYSCGACQSMVATCQREPCTLVTANPCC